MFNVTKIVAYATKTERRLAKHIYRTNPDSMEKLAGNQFMNRMVKNIIVKKSGNNVFTRAFQWCKTFVKNFKSYKKSFLDARKDAKKEGKNVKAVMKQCFALLKAGLKSVRKNVNDFVKENPKVAEATTK